MLSFILKVGAGVVVGSAAAAVYAYRRALARPAEDVTAHGREPRKPGEWRIVCAGDSLTHATFSYDYCRTLRERLGPSARILNAGVNGDLAWNLAERLPSIIDAAPDDVVVLIGTNDICGEQTASIGERQVREKTLPESPTFALFERELHRILSALKTQTQARIILVTPPLCGEDLSHPVHQRLQKYAAAIAAIAPQYGAKLIPFHREMEDALRRSGHVGRPGFNPGWREVMWMMIIPFQRYLFGMSYDRIAKQHGLWGSPDLIHLNETSGEILARLLEEALREANRQRAVLQP